MTVTQAVAFLKKQSPLRITVSGDIGAGKSTFAKRLAQEIGIPRIYIGQFMREEAKKRGMTLDEFGALQEKDDSIDRRMDAMQAEKSQKMEKGIFEGRTAWHFVHEPTIKIFLSADLTTAAQRIWQDASSMRQKYDSIDELRHAILRRKQSENNRYGKYYGIDVYNYQNFDLVIDTKNRSIEEVFEVAIIEITEFLRRKTHPIT